MGVTIIYIRNKQNKGAVKNGTIFCPLFFHSPCLCVLSSLSLTALFDVWTEPTPYQCPLGALICLLVRSVQPPTPKKKNQLYKQACKLVIIFLASNSAYCPICLATSAAKSSFLFSRPSPVSKRTNLLTLNVQPFSFATFAMY